MALNFAVATSANGYRCGGLVVSSRILGKVYVAVEEHFRTVIKCHTADAEEFPICGYCDSDQIAIIRNMKNAILPNRPEKKVRESHV